MDNDSPDVAFGKKAFEKIAIVFCVLVVIFAFLTVTRLAIIDARLYRVEVWCSDVTAPPEAK